MRHRSALVACAVVFGMLAAALPAAAQATGEPISWLINVTVKPGKSMDLEKAAQKYDKPVFDKLLADGAISSYGLAHQLIGPPGDSYMYWVTASDWSAMGKVEKAFEDHYKALKPEEAKASMEAFIGATEPEKESSGVARHIVFQGTPGAKPGYLMRHVYKVKPGKGSEAVKMYKQYDAPVYQKLLEAGVITGYGLAVPDMHTGAGWTHTSWITFTDMSNMDAINKAFDDADKANGEELNQLLQKAWLGMNDTDSHYDSLMKITMYGGQAAK
jgi:hypothetical protein